MSESPYELVSVPLVEAIIEVRFPGDVRIEVLRGDFQLGIADELPLLFVPQLQAGDVPELLPYRFVNEEQTRTAALSIHSLSYSSKRYPGWEEFKSEWSWLWSELISRVAIERLTRISVRYINRFGGELGQKLNMEAAPSYLVVPLQDECVKHRSTTEYLSDPTSLIINVEKGGGNGSLVVDYDCFVQDVAAEDLESNLELLHDRIEHEFLRALGEEYSRDLGLLTVRG